VFRLIPSILLSLRSRIGFYVSAEVLGITAAALDSGSTRSPTNFRRTF